MRDDWNIIRRYYRALRPPVRELVLLFVTHLVGTVPYMITPLMFGLILRHIGEGNLRLTLIALAGYFGLKTASKFGYWFNFGMTKRYYKALYLGMQKRLLDKLDRANMAWFSAGNRGNLLNVANVDLRELAGFGQWLNEFFGYVISFGVAVVILLGISPLLMLFCVGINLLVITILNRWNAKYALIVADAKHKTDEETDFFSQMISGMPEIKSFHLMDKIRQIYRAKNDEYVSLNDKKVDNMRVKDVLIPSLTMFAEMCIMAYLTYRAFRMGLGVDMIVVVNAYCGRLFGDLQAIIGSLSRLRDIKVAVDRYCATVEGGDASRDTGRDIDVPRGLIEITNVDFGYGGDKVLSGLNARIEPGQITALVGPSGSGKSTVFNLLTRLYRPERGTITIDGTDVADFSDAAYGRSVAVIRQDPFLFRMSVMDNLALINPDRAAIERVCRDVHLDEFIRTLPEGYDTVLSEDAADLSGGQKQRLAIARALLTGAKILLCDELTSALDEGLAKSIFDLLEQIKADHTIVIITHKAQERDRADAIVSVG